MTVRSLSVVVLGLRFGVGAALVLSAGCSDTTRPIDVTVEQPKPQPDPAPPPPPTQPASKELSYIYFASTSGTVIARLALGDEPVFSPDGRRIAFHRDSAVFVMDVDGSHEYQLALGGDPSWSPDGTRIVFSSFEGISVMDTDGTDVRTLIRHDFRDDTYPPWDMGVGSPAWSRDGTQIAFVHRGDGDTQPSQIFVMGVDGSNPHQLTMSGNGARYAESDPAWSNDGRKLALWSFGYGIAWVGSQGGVPLSLMKDFPAVAYYANLQWSPDDRFITFDRRQPDGYAVWSLKVDAANARELIPNARDAAWSPDGKWIAFVSGPNRL